MAKETERNPFRAIGRRVKAVFEPSSTSRPHSGSSAAPPPDTQSESPPPPLTPSKISNRMTGHPLVSPQATGTAGNVIHSTNAQSSPSSTLPRTPNRTTNTPSGLQHASPKVGNAVQPPLSPPSALPPLPPLVTLEELRGAGGLAWTGLERTLQAIERSTDAFPVLKSPVAAFLECVDIVKAVVANRQEYSRLAEEMQAIVDILRIYTKEMGLKEKDDFAHIHQSTTRLSKKIVEIDKKAARGKMEKAIYSSQDQDDIMDCYQQIEGAFRQFQIDVTNRTWRNTQKLLEMGLLDRLPLVSKAMHDSKDSREFGRRSCTPETRQEVLNHAKDWVGDPNSQNIYWMNGMAGTGKTTISYTLCEWLEDLKRPAASFFCSRNSLECRALGSIIPSIANQLAKRHSLYQYTLLKAMEQDRDIAERDIVKQFRKLLEEPLKDVTVAMLGMEMVVVVDALDECEDFRGVQTLLQLLLSATNLPLKFFVTSRPELRIREKMERTSSDGLLPRVMHLHTVKELTVKADIKRYFEEEFRLRSFFPTPDEINELVKRARNLFIYAATVLHYILPEKQSVDSSLRLRKVLGNALKPSSASNTNNIRSDNNLFSNTGPLNAVKFNMYEELDNLYETILTAALGGLDSDEVGIRHGVLRTAVCAIEPMSLTTASLILQLPEKSLKSHLTPLASVIQVSDGVISPLHASFPDYLFDERRSGKAFYCDEKQHNGLLALRCFRVMDSKDGLRFNICRLESSFLRDEDVLDLSKRVKKWISTSLVYACRYWGEHLARAGVSEVSEALHEMLGKFLEQRLLFWMEVLNLGKWIGEGIPILSKAQKWLSINKLVGDTARHVADARIFMMQFAATACSWSTPHLYLSAFAFCSQSGSVKGHYRNLIQQVRDVTGTIMNHRDQAPLAIWDTDSRVNCVAFSPDGSLIVSGSADATIRVWNALTGDRVADPLEGHTGSVNSVAFSPDGSLIASGSNDKTIRVWNALTGDRVAGPLEGHTDWVRSVAFSPDGSLIASGSADVTIRVWNALTGDRVADPLKGHTGSVNSVAFSPDGSLIASGSNDRTIRVWNALTGDRVAGPLEGHTDWVRSVAFFPDGSLIASGSDDATIRVWNALTGDRVADPLEGHTGSVNSVAFSPDGSLIASGSNDKTIRVWNALTGDRVAGPLEGHTDWVHSVAFSPDGSLIASGSNDKTIRVWNALTGDRVAGPLEGHTDWVRSVAFSPDGSLIASGSADVTIRVWNALTGDRVAGPLEGHTGSVNSVAFSPDGSLIASGFDDEVTRVWKLPGLLEGHTDIVSANTENRINQSSGLQHGSPHSYLNRPWILKDDGWITNGDALLFWTPPDLRHYVPRPSNTVVIASNGTLSINYSNIVLGDQWAECWVSK